MLPGRLCVRARRADKESPFVLSAVTSKISLPPEVVGQFFRAFPLVVGGPLQTKPHPPFFPFCRSGAGDLFSARTSDSFLLSIPRIVDMFFLG